MGRQSLEVMNENPNVRMLGIAAYDRTAISASSITSTPMALARVESPSMKSPTRGGCRAALRPAGSGGEYIGRCSEAGIALIPFTLGQDGTSAGESSGVPRPGRLLPGADGSAYLAGTTDAPP